MSDRILIAYASRYGSTAEAAEAIGKRLAEKGMDADVRPARDVASLDGYRAVVLASPLYIGSLLKDASGFVERHSASLARLPVAVFALGPISGDDDIEEAQGQLDAALAKLPPIDPVAKRVFVGRYDPAKLNFGDRIVSKLPVSPLKGAPARDDRDWAAITAWADGLPDVFAARE
jgi:menaquinone-dependent protoporphyrinogen oxidase